MINLSTFVFDKNYTWIIKKNVSKDPHQMQSMRIKRNLKEFKWKFRLIDKFHNKGNTDDFQVKNKSKFFLENDNNSELDTYFENL